MDIERSQGLTPKSNKEILEPFPLAHRLFDLASKQFQGISRSAYAEPEHANSRYTPIELPGEFSPLVASYPGQYFVVAYENRLDAYYAKGTRFQGVLLSTAQHRYDSDETVREIEVTEYDSSEGKGNKLFVVVTESVNDKGFTTINTAEGEALNRPHGSRKISHVLNSQGEQEILRSEFSRLDEGLFEWKGAQKPVRWVRDFSVEKKSDVLSEVVYRESYLIGRDGQGATEEEAAIKIKAQKEHGVFTNISVEIGPSGGKASEVLFEDSEQNVRVVVNDSWGIKVYANQKEIVQQDPNYSFLFTPPVDKEAVLRLVESKMSLIEQDWNKPGAVFGVPQIEDDSHNTLGGTVY